MIKRYIKGLKGCLAEVENQENTLYEIRDMIMRASDVFIMGNGGSASTAQHFAQGLSDLGIHATCLTDNVALLTALANDFSYEDVFLNQLTRKHVGEFDLVIGITGSGMSENILRAVSFAEGNEAKTVGLIGFGGGELRNIVDEAIVLTSKDFGQIEDTHLAVCHMLCYLIREKMSEK